MNKRNVQKRNSNAYITKRPSLKSKADAEIISLSLKQSHQIPLKSTSSPITKSKTGLAIKSPALSDSIDSETLETESKQLQKNLKNSLKLFKSATTEFIIKNNETESEVDVFHQNFFQVQSEVSEILQETTKSRTEIQEIKKKLEKTNEKVNEIQSNLYTESLSIDYPNSKAKTLITSLKSEINLLKNQLKSNEDTLKTINLQNFELRLHSYRLKENFSFKKFSEDSSPSSGCQSCEII
jgi:chromosome segregation ATPase